MAEHPLARSRDLIVETLGDELLVFDAAAHRAHSLNASAAAVWHACDGTRAREQIAAHTGLDPLVVELALDTLATNGLLVDFQRGPRRVSRRAMLRRVATSGAGLGIALPIIRSITAPTAAMATSAPNPGGACNNDASCGPASHCRSNSLCEPGSCGTSSPSFSGLPCSTHPCCVQQSCRDLNPGSVSCFHSNRA